MKKMIKRGICVLLCLVMVCSIPICASAANKNYKQFTSLFSIGDSNTMGYGLKGYKDYENRDYLHGLKGTFTAYVRDYVGAEDKCNTMAYPGLRTKDVLYYLGGDVDMTGDKYFEKYSKDSWAQGLVKDNGKNKNNFINQLKTAKNDNKLVLVATGPADVFYSAMQMTVANKDFGNKVLAAAAMLEAVRENYAEFLELFPKLIQRIQKLNPSATIVIVGYYNPFKNLKLSDLSLTSAFDSMTFISDDMNAHFKSWAKKYGCLYADITNAETYTLEKGLTFFDLFSDGNGKIYHLTADGHKYVARQILGLLKVKKDPVTTNITVDLGSVTSASSVKVDGKAVTDYTYTASNHKLVVTNKTKTAKSMTVTEVFKDGKTYVASYTLSWEEGTGYIAHCTSMTKSSGFSSSFLTSFFDIFSSFSGIFSSILTWLANRL